MVSFIGMPAVRCVRKHDCKFKKNENELGLQLFEKKELKQGDKAEIIDDPFEGYKAIYQNMKSTVCISVLLDIVRKNTQATLSVYELATVISQNH